MILSRVAAFPVVLLMLMPLVAHSARSHRGVVGKQAVDCHRQLLKKGSKPPVPEPLQSSQIFAAESGFQLEQIINTKGLSGRGVVLLELNDGRKFVVRPSFPAMADPCFEKFAGAVMADAPGVHVPRIQVLSANASKALTSALLRDPRLSEYVDKLCPPFSLTKYVFGSQGVQALESFGIDDPNPSDDAAVSALALNMQRVPQNIRHQLSDLWVLYTLLGIWDFHRENWINSSDGIVHAVDFAFRSLYFDKGIDIPAASHMYPYAGPAANVVPLIARLLLKDVSPEILKYLRDLRPETILAISVSSEFSLTHQALYGMELRRRNLVDKILRARTE